jgi:hypothetical protein
MTSETVTVRVDPATAQTLMDWNVLHFTDAGWTLDLDIWRTRTEAITRTDEVVRLREALTEAKLQLEYLDEKFQRTGTTASILARINAALHRSNPDGE